MKYDLIYSSDGKDKGIPTGAQYMCRLEGCNGSRITTKWNDGSITHPCSRGLTPFRKHWKIMGEESK